jgi:hypothetical protein
MHVVDVQDPTLGPNNMKIPAFAFLCDVDGCSGALHGNGSLPAHADIFRWVERIDS